jgi:ribose transport system ATP-binding protein
VVEKLVVPGWPGAGVNLTVRRGEILGLAGLVGAGRTELLRTLFGVVPATGGRMLVEGREVRPRTPAEAIRAGLALVPEDRKEQGLMLALSVRHNIGLPGLGRHRRTAGLTNGVQEQADAAVMVAQLGIRTPGLDQRVQLLSGGNQQKVVLGKWLALRPQVLLLDEPTRGVDVGAKQELYRLIEELADQGVAILFASSDLEELLRLADRVLVMYQGRLAGELSREAASEEAIMRLATG